MSSTSTIDDQFTLSIPIISFVNYATCSLLQRRQTATQLVNACTRYGFAYITDHGVPASTIQCAFDLSAQFFASSVASKMKAPHPPGWAVHRGYSWPGLEKVSNATSGGDGKSGEGDTNGNEVIAAQIAALREVTDVKESFDMGSDGNLEQPNQWPPEELYPGFRGFMTRFYEEMNAAAAQVLRALALGLLSDGDGAGGGEAEIDEDTFVKLHSGAYNQLRLLHYPPIPIDEMSEYGKTKTRMPSHTDWSTITLLFQDSVGGLEVEVTEGGGKYMAVPPLPSDPYAMVMNVGDLMVRWSNDRLKSTEHRVGLPPVKRVNGASGANGAQGMTKARYSIPYFLTTDPDLVIECLATRKGEEPKYEPITQRDYNAMRASMQY
jgi:isopenicillin N synthase-like dioxygenase